MKTDLVGHSALPRPVSVEIVGLDLFDGCPRWPFGFLDRGLIARCKHSHDESIRVEAIITLIDVVESTDDDCVGPDRVKAGHDGSDEVVAGVRVEGGARGRSAWHCGEKGVARRG